MSNIDHILLYLILFISAFLWSKANVSNKRNLGVIFSLIYVFVIGSRTWGPDYDWYKYKVDNPHDLTVQEDEIGFQWLNAVIRIIGLNGDGAFYIYAVILMIGVVLIIHSYKENWQYMCLLVVPAIMLETSTHIRQGIAFSIALISFFFLKENKKFWAVIFALIAFNIHKIIIILFVLYFVAHALSKRKISLYVIILAYTIATFLPHVLNLDSFMQYLNVIQIGGKYSGYVDNGENWFSTDANNAEWQQSTVTLMLSYLYDIALFVVVSFALKMQENKYIRTLFYLFVIGAIFVRFFFLNELLRRTFTMPYIIYFIPVGYSLSYFSTKTKYLLKKKEYNTYKVCCCLIFVYIALYWGRFIFANKDCNFLWT